MADITDLVNYYVNLLIIQYNQKTKARATVDACVTENLANGILLDIRDGYSVDTAVGVQLDIIGKYVGVDRFFNVTDPVDYFSFTDYTENDPDSEQKYGLTDYADFDEFQFNGTLNYNSLITVENRLNDTDYRVIIKLKIVQNNSNHSHKSIDDSMWEFFQESVRPSSVGGMQMVYFISGDKNSIIQASLEKNILPRPMGVGVTLINDADKNFFGFTTYSDVEDELENNNITGFDTYSDYGTKEGQMLIYNQIEV